MKRLRVCCRFGLGRFNETSRELVKWCDENGLAYANSYVKLTRKGTLFHMRYAKWYYEREDAWGRERDEDK